MLVSPIYIGLFLGEATAELKRDRGFEIGLNGRDEDRLLLALPILVANSCHCPSFSMKCSLLILPLHGWSL
jgi:hypothetical protein